MYKRQEKTAAKASKKLTCILPVAFLEAHPSECGGGLVFLPAACDLKQIFVNETLRHHSHHEVAALQMGAPNLPAETPSLIEIGRGNEQGCGWKNALEAYYNMCNVAQDGLPNR